MTHRNACHQVKPALIMEEAMTKVFKLKLSAIQKDTCMSVTRTCYVRSGWTYEIPVVPCLVFGSNGKKILVGQEELSPGKALWVRRL
jgi:hypothetical protein